MEEKKAFMPSSNFEFAKADQFDNSLRPAFHVQFLHDVGNMVPHCLFADKQHLGDIFGRFILNEQFKHFAFAVR